MCVATLAVELAMACSHDDVACVDFFRAGAPLLGKLAMSGNGRPEVFPKFEDLGVLKDSSVARNARIVRGLREDEFSQELYDLTVADSDLNRMSKPVPFDQAELGQASVAPRFAVQQGLRSDGSAKIRPVDDMSSSGVNRCCQPTERLRNDGIDMLMATAQFLFLSFGVLPHLFKVDVDVAFRRVPIDPSHRWARTVHVKDR